MKYLNYYTFLCPKKICKTESR